MKPAKRRLLEAMVRLKVQEMLIDDKYTLTLKKEERNILANLLGVTENDEP